MFKLHKIILSNSFKHLENFSRLINDKYEQNKTSVNQPTAPNLCSQICSKASRSFVNVVIYMGVSKNRGTPKRMVKTMENPIN